MAEFFQRRLLQWGIHKLLRLLVIQFSLTSLATGVLRDSPGTLYKDVFPGDIWDMVSISHGW